MSNANKFLFLFCLFIKAGNISFSQEYNPDYRYPVQQLQEDFRFLRKKLEKVNPGLYLYTSKQELDSFFDSLYNSIKNPLSERQFYNIITLLNSKIKDGHTMFLPGEKAMNYFNEHVGFFPFYIVIQEGKLYVSMNCSSDTTIKEGDELIFINGADAEAVIDYLLKRQIRDGNNSTYPQWILTTYFKSYYGFAYGHPDSFFIGFRHGNDELKTIQINSLPNDSIRFYRLKKYVNRISEIEGKKGIFLEIDKRKSIATLTIPSFSNYTLKSEYKQHFKTEIERSFKTISDSSINHLLIDIRNNQGGDWEPGRFLLSYLINKPVRYLENSTQSKIIEPADSHFTGNLYVLINGGSFSNSGIVSSCLEQVGRAVFVGEETAGNKTIINGEPAEYILPNTKIAMQVSTRIFKIRSGINDGHGVQPSYMIKPGIKDIISGKDLVKEFVIQLIMKSK